MADWRFDTQELFDDDYLFFYTDILTDEVSDRQTDLIWRLLELEPRAQVLDIACGHGRIANRLAVKGASVTGLDVTSGFLDRARMDARASGVEVDYVHGDMRKLAWEDRFDAVTCVFSSFGYFADDDNRRVLEAVRRALRPGGRLYLDLNHLPWLLANFRDREVVERDGQWMIDRNRYDPLNGRTINDRTIIRDGLQRSFQFSVRMFTFPEVCDWLIAAGFGEVEGFSGRGEELTIDAPRMVIVAR
ncbi:MAG: class I SAM-dependent methyltransferase [Nitriliruptoraceae bacterium]